MVSLIFYNCEVENWTMPQTWVVNVSEPRCINDLLNSSNNRLGLDQTYFFTSILFFITGMGFGTSYSLVHVDCLDWVHTSVIRRIIRGFLGCGIMVGAFYLFQLIPCNDNPTRFFFHYGLPALSLSFFIYGLFPLICLKIGLVQTDTTPRSIGTNEDILRKRRLAQIEAQLSDEDEDEDKSEAVAK